MRIDSHQHFWRYDPVHHGWMSDQMDALRRDYLPGELEPLLRSAAFDGTIAVQARQLVEETDFLLHLADAHAFITGVVGWVDLCSPYLDAQLARYSCHPKLVGVRHVVHDEPDDDFMLRADFRAGIARLREHGLTYDLLLFPKHLPPAVRLAQEFPDQPFVLDHIAKPFIRAGQLSPWSDDLARLADVPNVCCKLSGLVTEAHWQRWRAEDIHPYLDVVVDAFGSERLMIGSDWPVCTLAASYAAVMAVVSDYVQRLPAEAREGVLGGNAARFYGLERSPSGSLLKNRPGDRGGD